MKKIFFKYEEQIDEETWKASNDIDYFKLETALTDPKLLLPLVQESIDHHWNSRLRSHENPRRAVEIVKVEDYVAPKKVNWDNFNDDEDDIDDYDEGYDD